MASVFLRKINNDKPEREYALMIRDYTVMGVNWTTLGYMDDYTADQLNNKTITFWEGEPELTPTVRELRLEHPALREAWENYQTIKSLISK